MSITPISTSVPVSAYTTSKVAGARWDTNPGVDEQNWSDLERLTPSDRALIKRVTGQNIPTRASGKPPIAPLLAFQISGDRKDGVIPAGQPVTASYIKGLIDRYTGHDNPFGDELDKALTYLTDDPPTNGVDVEA